MKIQAALLLICALGLLPGCQTEQARGQQTAREYRTALNALIGGYADTMAAQGKLPMPPASLPRRAKDAILADRLDQTSETNAVLARQLSVLTPPPGPIRIHAVLVDLFEATGPEYHRWTAALRASDRKAAEHSSDRIQQMTARDTAILKTPGVRFPA